MDLVDDMRVVVPAVWSGGSGADGGRAGAAAGSGTPTAPGSSTLRSRIGPPRWGRRKVCPALLRPLGGRVAHGPVSLGRPVRVCVPIGRSHGRVRPGGARRLAGQERVGAVDRLLAGIAVVLASAAVVVVLGLLAEFAAAR